MVTPHDGRLPSNPIIHTASLYLPLIQALKSFVVVRRAYPMIFYERYSCILPFFITRDDLLRNGLISLRFSSVSLMEIRSISLCSQPFSNDSKLSHGWFLVHWLSPDSSHVGLARILQLQNFQNEIEQITPVSCVHLQHPRRKLHKFFCMFVLRFCLFIVKKHHNVFLQKFHSFSNQYNLWHDWWITKLYLQKM